MTSILLYTDDLIEMLILWKKNLRLNWYQNYFQDQIDVNFKILGLNWYQKIFYNQFDVNFKMLQLKKVVYSYIFRERKIKI